MEKRPVLNIASIGTATYALGPGLRSVVWVQGCPFRCSGCIAPGWIPFREAFHFSPEELATQLLSHPDVTGVTISGGEPLLQAEGLAETLRIVKQRRNVDVICFTGFLLSDLQKSSRPGVREFLGELDVLIDGPYIEALNDGVGLRGSSNQKVHYLTGRLAGFDFETCRRNVEISVQGMELSIVGIPTRQALASLQTAFETRVGLRSEVIYEWT